MTIWPETCLFTHLLTFSLIYPPTAESLISSSHRRHTLLQPSSLLKWSSYPGTLQVGGSEALEPLSLHLSTFHFISLHHITLRYMFDRIWTWIWKSIQRHPNISKTKQNRTYHLHRQGKRTRRAPLRFHSIPFDSQRVQRTKQKRKRKSKLWIQCRGRVWNGTE